jgi:protein-disulfide isomerase
MKLAVTLLLASIPIFAQAPAAPKSASVPEAPKSASVPPAPKSALDKVTLEAYLRYSELWIPQVTVKIDDPKPSTAIDGFYDVAVHLTYNGATKDDLYYVSKDGKSIVKGTAYKIAESPFAATEALLKVDRQPGYGAAENTAAVKLVVFSDFQCPFCQKEEQELRKNVPAAFADKVRVYFTDFPLTSIHPWAMKGSIAGRCVYRASADAFWNYHDWIYENQKDITLENFDAKLQEFAKQKFVDGAKLSACMNDKDAAAEVEKTMALGHDLSVSATPTLFLNGRKLEGGVEWPVLQQLLQIEIDHRAAEVKLAKKEDDSCCTVNIPILGGAAKK